MRIEVYLDGDDAPFQTLTPPEKFRLDTNSIADGEHSLTFQAIDDDGTISRRIVHFTVQNGPAIAVHGVVDGDVLSGNVGILANAYGSKIGDEFEPVRMETPAPVPTWAWVLALSVLAWGAGYVGLELHDRIDTVAVHTPVTTAVTDTPMLTGSSWAVLGEQVYGNNCGSCHQINGVGLPGVFPPLTNNAVVQAEDPDDHIRAILNGVSGKVIDGVAYPAAMPPFVAVLNDAEVAAVVNHERSQWGSGAPTTTAEAVARLRGGSSASGKSAASDKVAEEAQALADASLNIAMPTRTDQLPDAKFDWVELGAKVYANQCVACHQAGGTGIPGVFPPLVGNSSVLADDATDHIRAVLQGLANKEIDGIAYPAPMQAFAGMLSDEEIAAVVNHERSQWGNNASIVVPADVHLLR